MSVYEDYLYELGIIVKEMALEAKGEAKERKTDFSVGYMAGFHRLVSLMQQQAEAFDIPVEKLGLDNIDPDVDLV